MLAALRGAAYLTDGIDSMRFAGSLVALATPMNAEGAIDHGAWSRLLEFHLAAGTNGIIVGGSTGESVCLEEFEVHELLKRAQAQLRGRMPLIASIGGSSTGALLERVRRLAEIPHDGLLMVTPAYNKPTQEGLYRHFAAVAEVARAPIIVYNVPSRTAVDLMPATVARLAKLPRIVALKEATGTVARIQELLATLPADFAVLSGDDASCCQASLLGAKGVISVTANVAPALMNRMIAAAVAGRRAEAESLDALLQPLHRAQSVEANPIPIKWALTEMGLIGRGIRLPLTWLSEAQQPLVRAALAPLLPHELPRQSRTA